MYQICISLFDDPIGIVILNFETYVQCMYSTHFKELPSPYSLKLPFKEAFKVESIMFKGD